MNQTIHVIKAGTGVVSNIERTCLDIQAINNIGRDMSDSQLQIVLVSSGAVTAGIERLGWTRAEVDASLDLKRVASMAGNTALISAWEQATGKIAAADLPTHNDLSTAESWRHLERAIGCSLQNGLLPILNEGDARSSEELETTLCVAGKEFKRFGDNDWLAAHTAAQLGAHALDFLTDMDGVMQSGQVLDSLNLDEIDSFIKQHVNDEGCSNGGMTSKLLAAKFAIQSGVDRVVIRNGKHLWREGTIVQA